MISTRLFISFTQKRFKVGHLKYILNFALINFNFELNELHCYLFVLVFYNNFVFSCYYKIEHRLIQAYILHDIRILT